MHRIRIVWSELPPRTPDPSPLRAQDDVGKNVGFGPPVNRSDLTPAGKLFVTLVRREIRAAEQEFRLTATASWQERAKSVQECWSAFPHS